MDKISMQLLVQVVRTVAEIVMQRMAEIVPLERLHRSVVEPEVISLYLETLVYLVAQEVGLAIETVQPY